MVSGVIGFPPMSALKCVSQSSLNVPMLRYTRLSAPSAPTESDPSFSTRGVHTVSGFSNSVDNGPSEM